MCERQRGKFMVIPRCRCTQSTLGGGACFVKQKRELTHVTIHDRGSFILKNGQIE
jgi:hypothetical protein